jgi:hypothetical protein
LAAVEVVEHLLLTLAAEVLVVILLVGLLQRQQ